MACNMEAGLKTWRAYGLARHVNTPYSPIRGRATLKPTGNGPKRASLEYIFAAALDAPHLRRQLPPPSGAACAITVYVTP
jgi:hypothetical protein